MEQEQKDVQYLIPFSLQIGSPEFQNAAFETDNSAVLLNGLVNWENCLYAADEIWSAGEDFPLNTLDRDHLAEGLLLGWQEQG